MGRAEMLARMDSQELSGWSVLFTVKSEEREAAEDRARMKSGSDDGEIIEFNKPPSEDDDEDDLEEGDGGAD